MHAIRCVCGAIRGHIKAGGTANRVVCYCKDCRAFARYCERAKDVLDANGGTHIVQVAQHRLAFISGTEQLAAIRLSAAGMVRWYARCCGTPIGNTSDNWKFSFIGLIHTCLDRGNVDRDFGSAVALVNTASAVGDNQPTQRGLAGAIMRFIWILAITRLSGRYQRTSLFNASGQPVVTPRVLTPQERARLNDAPP